MGCCSSSAAAADNSARLLDTYKVDKEPIGQGAYGIVYACQPKKGTGNEDLAVKMVDKVDTPLAKIEEEVAMLQKMNHANIVKCHDVVYERCFVCIVMDRLRGGDLIDCMKAHWDKKGKIPVLSTRPITKQMAASLHYLHEQCIIHRDVKGDNFLCDRPEITDANLRVVLTDFGIAVPCKPDQRLREQVGTKLYWAPELYKLNYSLKVDIWAMGVLVYGLLNGTFPFRDKRDIDKKKLNVPEAAPPECKKFLFSVLDKVEENRPDSTRVVTDPWLTGRKGSKTVSFEQSGEGNDAKPPVEAGEQGGGEISFDTQADFTVARTDATTRSARDRRTEMVDRMRCENERQNRPQSKAEKLEEPYWREWFSFADPDAKNSSRRYEWWPQNKVDEAALVKFEGATSAARWSGDSAGSLEAVGQQLKEHGIDTKKLGWTPPTLEKLAREIQSGGAMLRLDAASHRKLVRVVDLVLVRICPPGSPTTYLIETGEKLADGRSKDIARLPGTTKLPHMNSKQMAETIARGMLNLGGAKVEFDYDAKEVYEVHQESTSYPGITTVYRKQIIPGCLAGDESNYIGKSAKVGGKDWAKQDQAKNTKYFAWMAEKDCDKKGVMYMAPLEGVKASTLVQAPVGFAEEALRKYFESNRIDVARFGVGEAKTLEDFSVELMNGESSLMLDNQGFVTRVVDEVVIKCVRAGAGKTLVLTEKPGPGGKSFQVKQLPSTMHRFDENHFLTARSLLTRQLGIDENHAFIDARPENVQIVESAESKDSPAYPGLRNVCRKRILTATIASDLPLVSV